MGLGRRSLSRRTVLRGIGASMALPLLDAMIPASGLSRAASGATGATASGAATAAPVRMAAIFMPNGVHYADWEPTGVGRDYTLSRTLETIAPVKDDLLVLSNLCLENAR